MCIEQMGALLNALNKALAEEKVGQVVICVPQCLSPAHDLHEINVKLYLTNAVKHVLWLTQ